MSTTANSAKQEATRVKDVFEALGVPDPQIERDKVALAAAINRALGKRGKTQAQRAAALGAAQPVVSNLERFELAGFSLERLFRYAHHLDVKASVQMEEPPSERRLK